MNQSRKAKVLPGPGGCWEEWGHCRWLWHQGPGRQWQKGMGWRLVLHIKEGEEGVVVGGLGRRGGEILTVASPQALAEV